LGAPWCPEQSVTEEGAKIMPLPLPPHPTDRSTRKFASQLYGWLVVFVLILASLANLAMH
jgi:hypothetical protein